MTPITNHQARGGPPRVVIRLFFNHGGQQKQQSRPRGRVGGFAGLGVRGSGLRFESSSPAAQFPITSRAARFSLRRAALNPDDRLDPNATGATNGHPRGTDRDRSRASCPKTRRRWRPIYLRALRVDPSHAPRDVVGPPVKRDHRLVRGVRERDATTHRDRRRARRSTPQVICEIKTQPDDRDRHQTGADPQTKAFTKPYIKVTKKGRAAANAYP